MDMRGDRRVALRAPGTPVESLAVMAEKTIHLPERSTLGSADAKWRGSEDDGGVPRICERK